MFQFCASTLMLTLKFNIRELKQHKAYKLSEKVKTIFGSDMFIFRNIMILERKKDPHHYEPYKLIIQTSSTNYFHARS